MWDLVAGGKSKTRTEYVLVESTHLVGKCLSEMKLYHNT